MKAYLQAFVSYEQNDCAKLFPMAEFAYNNAKNASLDYTLFEPNYSFYPRVFYEEDVDPGLKTKSAQELASELWDLLTTCWKNLQHAQNLQKQHHGKDTKPKSYDPDDKIWLNSNYIKSKQNRKPEAHLFDFFCMLHQVDQQAYKMKFSKK